MPNYDSSRWLAHATFVWFWASFQHSYRQVTAASALIYDILEFLQPFTTKLNGEKEKMLVTNVFCFISKIFLPFKDKLYHYLSHKKKKKSCL